MGDDNYFEGILQLRNTCTDVLDFAIMEIKKNDPEGISKVKLVANGFDVYVKKQRFLRSLGTKLQKKFHGQILISKRLHTRSRETSRDLYRVNLLFRPSPFKRGDIIDYKGDKIIVLAVHKKILAKDIKTGKKLALSFKGLIG